MSRKKQTYEWDIPISQVLSGKTVGIEIQLSQDANFKNIYSHYSSFDEITAGPAGRLTFSLDDGETWEDFETLSPVTLGESFTSKFRLKFEIFASDVECIYAIRGGVIYKISPDGRSIINKIDISGIGECVSLEYNTLKSALCLTSEKTTMFRISTKDGLSYYDKSINIGSTPLSIAIDESRNSFWQIDRDKICLKNWKGEKIFCLNNPLDELLDMDNSSSSSLSSVSSLSSYSTATSTSSSESSVSSPSSVSSSSSSKSTESIGNISSSSSTESILNFSSSSSSDSSPSSVSSESSTSSEALNGVTGILVRWEANDPPNYTFDDISMVINGQSNCRFSLLSNGADSNSEIARRIEISAAGTAQVTGQSNTFAPQRITIYLNGVNVFDASSIYYAQSFSYSFTSLQTGDTIEIRLRNNDGYDIYSHQIHPDGRIRARTTIAY